MQFKINVNATFEADDIDDAFIKLSEHFKALNEEGIDAPVLLYGQVLIEPVD